LEPQNNSAAHGGLYPEHHLFDTIVSTVLLILLLPVLLLIAATVLIGSGSPIFFKQNRVGKHGKLFRLFKFRTMRLHSAGATITADGDPRVTPIGKILRKFKLDELPQFLNVIRGEMSIVGPRPEVPEFVDLNSTVWREILQVRPGITDPTSIAYRNEEQLIATSSEPVRYYREIVLPNKLAMNRAYMKHRTVWRDCKLILQTARCAISPGTFNIQTAGAPTGEDSQ
jgi:lipopolysaccharide/colanic/teichoic acid biosynthesis glycosyltransferase